MTGNKKGALGPSWPHLPVPETAAPQAACLLLLAVGSLTSTSTLGSQGWWTLCRDQNQSGVEARVWIN